MTNSALPAVAAAASWMESFHMPMREIYKRFTKSELAIMGWRSAELAYNMHVSHGRGANDGARRPLIDEDMDLRGRSEPDVEHQLRVMGEALAPIAKKMVNERGEIDLRRLTGPEALRYFAVLGIPIGGRVLR